MPKLLSENNPNFKISLALFLIEKMVVYRNQKVEKNIT